MIKNIFITPIFTHPRKRAIFLSEYKPLQNRIKLKYHSDSTSFIRLWMESGQGKEMIWIGHGPSRRKAERNVKSPDRTYFQIDYEQPLSDDYVFEIVGHGGRNGKGTLDLTFLPDTIVFQIIEKNPIDSIGWHSYLNGQQIFFVIKK